MYIFFSCDCRYKVHALFYTSPFSPRQVTSSQHFNYLVSAATSGPLPNSGVANHEEGASFFNRGELHITLDTDRLDHHPPHPSGEAPSTTATRRAPDEARSALIKPLLFEGEHPGGEMKTKLNKPIVSVLRKRTSWVKVEHRKRKYLRSNITSTSTWYEVQLWWYVLGCQKRA